MQTMLNVLAAYANRNRYLISEQKSCILVIGDNTHNTWTLNGNPLQSVSRATHLGITRDNTSRIGTSEVTDERVAMARRSSYALLGAGFHGLNGLNPKYSAHLLKCYILPRLLYGLDVINMNKKDLELLSVFYLKTLKGIQHLPQRTATSAVLLLLGKVPIEAEIHKLSPKTFGNVVRNSGSVECKLATRQLAIKSEKSSSWFTKLTTLTELYELPSNHELLKNPPPKRIWKNIVDNAVEDYWFHKLKEDAANKSSLQFLNLQDSKKGIIHPIWETCGTDPFATTMAAIKMKLATGTYILQRQSAKFKVATASKRCPICLEDPEDLEHFITSCTKLDHVRQKYMVPLYDSHSKEYPDLKYISKKEKKIRLQLIIDCSKFKISKETASRIETVSRGLCYQLHHHRLALLNRKKIDVARS